MANFPKIHEVDAKSACLCAGALGAWTRGRVVQFPNAAVTVSPLASGPQVVNRKGAVVAEN